MIKALLMVSIFLLGLSINAFTAPAEKIPVILDTDIGTDIDDAFALALIMNSPELELLGVTTVSGDTAARARIAAKMLWEAGGKWRQVPVVAGVPGPKQDINQAPWADGFVGPQILKESAVDFLRGKFHRYPGEITLIAIGELTNVAALLKADPLVAKKIKRIALMGGSVECGYGPGSKPEAEWNIKSNPQAAQVVFTSGIPIIMAPLDVTAMLKLDAEGRRRIFSSHTPLTNALADLYRLWKNETPTLFDPMAVAMLIDPGICQTKDLAIEVDSQGYTRVVEGRPANATVGLSTNPGKFFQFYFSRVGLK
ncbi:MAG TPA: nucleoside hydrolase [Terriglobia bacterium]|nr:nucleoside hydrolase [Terriglobia bacterium]